MMRSEPREDEPSVNIVMRSGISTGEDKGKQLEVDGWVCKAAEKQVGLDLSKVKENFMEAKKRFVEASTSESQGKSGGNDALDVDPSLLVTFLKTCMKLVRDRKVVEGLQELIYNYTCKNNPLPEHRVVLKVGKSKK